MSLEHRDFSLEESTLVLGSGGGSSGDGPDTTPDLRQLARSMGNPTAITLGYSFSRDIVQALDQEPDRLGVTTLGAQDHRSVFIVALNGSEEVIFEGHVAEGGTFTIDNGGKLDAQTSFLIYDESGTKLLQGIWFETSALEPLAIGDRFGSLSLQRAVLESGASVDSFGVATPAPFGGVDLGGLTDYLFFFADGSKDANWQGASKGFIGDVAVDGIQAKERTSGDVPFSGTVHTNDSSLSSWQTIVNKNAATASASLGQTGLIASLEGDLQSAFQQIDALAATDGFQSVAAGSLNGLNTQNGVAEVFVINVTSGFGVSKALNITGDADDFFVLRWDQDRDPTNGYQGTVKFQSGGGINPLGDLSPANFLHVAGNINASGGGSTPSGLVDDVDGLGSVVGSNVGGGGFFTGYWLTTGSPDKGETSSLSNAIFVGGWYTTTSKFSLTSGTSGVHVEPITPTETNGVPVAIDDSGITCADQVLTLDLLENDTDPDNDVLSVISISDSDETVGVGQTLTLASGATVTLNADGTVTYDGTVAHASLAIGSTVTDAFTYTASDGSLTDTAAAEVVVCGALNTLETIKNSLPTDGSFTVSFDYSGTGFFDVTIEGTGDARFDGVTFTEAYCVSAYLPINEGVPVSFNMYLSDASEIPAGTLNTADLDLVNWILNQDFKSMDNGDGTGTNYTDAEIQGAIWGLTDDIIFVNESLKIGTTANAHEIYGMAMHAQDAQGFVPGAGDIVGLILAPTLEAEAAGNFQPFIIGIAWDSLSQDCLCV